MGIVVIISLLFLMVEVDANTKAVGYQIEADRIDRIRSAADSEFIPDIIAKVKAVDTDHIEPATAALQARYDLTFAEADRLSRHLGNIWEGLQADYRFGLRDISYVRELLQYPDQEIFWESSEQRFEDCFAEWVNMIRAGETPIAKPPRNWGAEIGSMLFGRKSNNARSVSKQSVVIDSILLTRCTIENRRFRPGHFTRRQSRQGAPCFYSQKSPSLRLREDTPAK